MNPVISTPTPAISELLMCAQEQALKTHGGGEEATPAALKHFASGVRFAVLQQVALGLWEQFGVVEYSHISGLRISARLGNTLIGEPPIVVEYDFMKTRLPALIVTAKAA